jgi:hypothetical protein
VAIEEKKEIMFSQSLSKRLNILNAKDWSIMHQSVQIKGL